MKRNQSTTIDRHIDAILITVEGLRNWTSTPWKAKKTWCSVAMNWLEDLERLADAEHILDEIGRKR